MTYNRRHFMTTSALALAGTGLLRVPLIGQQPAPSMPPPVTRFEDVRRGVGIFSGRGGTIGWLANTDGALAVDSQFPDSAPYCIKGLQAKSPKGIDMLINTHYHGDHTGGNQAFKAVVKSIVQQERCAKLHKEFTEKNNTAAQQAYADVTFGESWSRTLGDEKIWANYYGPGHTGGDAVIFFEQANVVHMGDLMFNRLHPRIDRPSGASIKNWMALLEKVASRHKDATFIFGHAKPGLPVTGSAKELLYLRDYFTAALEHVRKTMRAGQTKEQITGVKELPGFPDHAASGQVLTLTGVLTAAYEELGGK